MGGRVSWRRVQTSGPCTCSQAPSPHRQLILFPVPPARLQPGAQAKYGGVFAGMLRSSPALQTALQRVATVAQLRQACLHLLPVPGFCLPTCAGHILLAARRKSPFCPLAPSPSPCSLLAPVQPGDRPLCVLNTHLFFHYMAPHIRTMHVWAMVQASAAIGLG